MRATVHLSEMPNKPLEPPPRDGAAQR